MLVARRAGRDTYSFIFKASAAFISAQSRREDYRMATSDDRRCRRLKSGFRLSIWNLARNIRTEPLCSILVKTLLVLVLCRSANLQRQEVSARDEICVGWKRDFRSLLSGSTLCEPFFREILTGCDHRFVLGREVPCLVHKNRGLRNKVVLLD